MRIKLEWKSLRFASFEKESKSDSGVTYIDIPIDEPPDTLIFTWETEEATFNQEMFEALQHLEYNARRSGADMGLALDFASQIIQKVKASK